MVIPTVAYSSETWSINAQERRKTEVFEMMCLRKMCDIRRMDRVRNSLIRKRCGCELSVLERVKKNGMKWLGFVKRMGEENLIKRAYWAVVEGNRERGRPHRRWRI